MTRSARGVAPSSAWPVATAAAVATALVAFWPAWRSMAQVWWTSETFGHGMLVPGLAAWLVWRQRTALRAIPARPAPLALVGVAACATLWMAGELAGANVVAQFAAVGAIPALVVALAGPAFARALAFPLGFLFFMVPAGEWLNPALMEVTADATVWAVAASGVPVFREGLQFALPTGRWSVVEACSGLRYVLAATVLGALFAHLNFTSVARQVAFVLACIAIALVANWVRAYVIVMTGHLSGMRLGVGDDHVVYGWAFFGAVMFGVFALGARWRDPRSPPAASAPAAPRRRRDAAPRGAARPGATAAVALAALAACVGVRLAAASLADVAPRTDADRLALERLGPAAAPPLALEPAYDGARAVVRGVTDAGRPVEHFVAYFARQAAGHEMIAHGNGLVRDRGADWSAVSVASREVRAGELRWPVREWRLRSARGERLVWEWFTVAGHASASERHAKARGAWAMLTGAGDHATVSVVSADLEPLPAAATHPADDALERARQALSPQAERVARFAIELTARR